MELRWLSRCSARANGWKIWVSNPDRLKYLFFSGNRPDLPWSPSSVLCSVYRRFLTVLMRQGHDDHSHASSAKDKNEWSFTSTPIYVYVIQVHYNVILYQYIIYVGQVA